MCLPLVRRPRVCLSLRRAERVATKARAHEAMCRSMHVLRVAKRSRSGAIGESDFGSQACPSVSQQEVTSTGAAFSEAGGDASSSGSVTLPFGTGAGRGGVQARACCASNSMASVVR
eukprot:3206706-Pleurochrysis_carterae.AAC.3